VEVQLDHVCLAAGTWDLGYIRTGDRPTPDTDTTVVFSVSTVDMVKSTMIVVSVMLFACLVAVNSERPAEGHGGHGDGHNNGHGGGHDSCVCTRNEYFIQASFNKTCKQDLLLEVKSTVDYIAVDVKQLKNISVEIQQAITDLSVAQQTSTDELKVQIREGFEQVTEKLEENQQVIRNESTTVIQSHQSSIAYLKQVDHRCFILCFLKTKFVQVSVSCLFVA